GSAIARCVVHLVHALGPGALGDLGGNGLEAPGLGLGELKADRRFEGPVLTPMLGNPPAVLRYQQMLQDDLASAVLDEHHGFERTAILARPALVPRLQHHGFREGEANFVLAEHTEDGTAVFLEWGVGLSAVTADRRF